MCGLTKHTTYARIKRVTKLHKKHKKIEFDPRIASSDDAQALQLVLEQVKGAFPIATLALETEKVSN